MTRKHEKSMEKNNKKKKRVIIKLKKRIKTRTKK